MKYDEAKLQFINAWGALGSSWGINKAMGQIHALLLISTKPLATEEIMEDLKISRGNANMNIRALIDWGIVKKELIPGERKEYFSTGKDIFELAKQVSKERKRREIEPILKVLNSAKLIEGKGNEVEEFRKVTKDLYDFSNMVDNILEKYIKSENKWIQKLLMKL